MPKDILLDDSGDLLFRDGDLVIGDSFQQEVAGVLQLNQGELRCDPLLGPGLVRMVNSKLNLQHVQTTVMVHLGRDGKDYDQVRDQLGFNTKTL